MEYSDFLAEVSRLAFIRDWEMADSVVLAVLARLIGGLDPFTARRLAGSLPPPLGLELSRVVRRPVRAGALLAEIADLYGTSYGEASELVTAVMRVTSRATGGAVYAQMSKSLPEDWGPIMDSGRPKASW